MTKQEFIKTVVDDVTIGGLLPMNLPTKRILASINDDIRKFRANDDRATVEDILFINTSGLGDCRIIKLPDDVKAVTRLEFTGNTRGINDFMGNINEGTTRLSSSDNDMISYASREFYNQLVRQIGVRFMPYDYTEFTQELVLEGDVKGNLFAEVHRYIPESALFLIDDFCDLCEAELTLQYCRANTFLKRKLVGGREIDYEAMKENAQAMIEAITKKWEDQKEDGVMMLD